MDCELPCILMNSLLSVALLEGVQAFVSVRNMVLSHIQ